MARNDTRKARAAMAPTRVVTMARRRGSVMAGAPVRRGPPDLEAGAAAAAGPWSIAVRPGRRDGAGGAWASGPRPPRLARPRPGRGRGLGGPGWWWRPGRRRGQPRPRPAAAGARSGPTLDAPAARTVLCRRCRRRVGTRWPGAPGG